MGVWIDVWDRRRGGRFTRLSGETDGLGLAVSAKYSAKRPYPPRSPWCWDRHPKKNELGKP